MNYAYFAFKSILKKAPDDFSHYSKPKNHNRQQNKEENKGEKGKKNLRAFAEFCLFKTRN